MVSVADVPYMLFCWRSICSMNGRTMAPNGVARTSSGSPTMSLGMPWPVRNDASSSLKLLQLCDSSEYVDGLYRGRTPSTNSRIISSGMCVRPSGTTRTGRPYCVRPAGSASSSPPQ